MTTQVCDQCGHVAPHDSGTPQTLPYQPKGSLTRELITVQECRNTGCHCNWAVWRDLLPSEPAL